MRIRKRPDIVYPVRRGEWNLELRYSLRSLVNLTHGRVILVGFIPSWVRGIVPLPRDQGGDLKWHATTKHLLHAVDSIPDLTDPFYLFNDDFYVMRKVKGPLPVYNRGDLGALIDEYRSKRHQGTYFQGMAETYALLKSLGYGKPLAFNLHVPLPIYHTPLQRAYLEGKGIQALHLRTLYGNLAGLQGETISDVKVYSNMRDWEDLPFLSSNDDLPHGAISRVLSDRFPGVSKYESD